MDEIALVIADPQLRQEVKRPATVPPWTGSPRKRYEHVAQFVTQPDCEVMPRTACRYSSGPSDRPASAPSDRYRGAGRRAP